MHAVLIFDVRLVGLLARPLVLLTCPRAGHRAVDGSQRGHTLQEGTSYFRQTCREPEERKKRQLLLNGRPVFPDAFKRHQTAAVNFITTNCEQQLTAHI